jgi:hypothetical protein
MDLSFALDDRDVFENRSATTNERRRRPVTASIFDVPEDSWVSEPRKKLPAPPPPANYEERAPELSLKESLGERVNALVSRLGGTIRRLISKR